MESIAARNEVIQAELRAAQEELDRIRQQPDIADEVGVQIALDNAFAEIEQLKGEVKDLKTEKSEMQEVFLDATREMEHLLDQINRLKADLKASQAEKEKLHDALKYSLGQVNLLKKEAETSNFDKNRHSAAPSSVSPAPAQEEVKGGAGNGIDIPDDLLERIMPGAGLHKIAGVPVRQAAGPRAEEPETAGAAPIARPEDAGGHAGAEIPKVSMEQVNRFYREVKVTSSEKARMQAALKNALEKVNNQTREERTAGIEGSKGRNAGLSPVDTMDKLKKEAEDGILFKLRKRLKS
jgi:hypothetical protein